MKVAACCFVLIVIQPLTVPTAGADQAVPPPEEAAEQEGNLTQKLKLRGFADVDLRTDDDPRSATSFALGQVDFFISSQLSEDLRVLGEVVFEAGDDNELVVDVERLLLQYSPSDFFGIAAGRFHTAIGYFNTAFHHGTWFQTTVDRPFLFAFEDEGGMLPIHNVGITVGGGIPSGRAGLRYVAEVGNGRASRSPGANPVQVASDENEHKAVNLALLARPEAVPGLQAGVSSYWDRREPAGRPKTTESILAFHAVYRSSTTEVLNEALFIRHAPSGERSVRTFGFYSQLARSWGRLQPYVRYQYVDAPGEDPILADVGRQYGPSLGLRRELGEAAALKVQYDRTTRRGLGSVNTWTLQAAFTF